MLPSSSGWWEGPQLFNRKEEADEDNNDKTSVVDKSKLIFQNEMDLVKNKKGEYEGNEEEQW